MIHFKESYFGEARKIVNELRDFSDVKEDLNKIDNLRDQIDMAVHNHFGIDEMNYILQKARELNDALRRKYPIIDEMLQVANRVPVKRATPVLNQGEQKPIEYVMLEQDRCGILCHMVLKKGLTQSIEEIIAWVE